MSRSNDVRWILCTVLMALLYYIARPSRRFLCIVCIHFIIYKRQRQETIYIYILIIGVAYSMVCYPCIECICMNGHVNYWHNFPKITSASFMSGYGTSGMQCGHETHIQQCCWLVMLQSKLLLLLRKKGYIFYGLICYLKWPVWLRWLLPQMTVFYGFVNICIYTHSIFLRQGHTLANQRFYYGCDLQEILNRCL